MDTLCQTYSLYLKVVKGFLHAAKKAFGIIQVKCNGVELTKYLVTLFCDDPVFGGGDCAQDLPEV